MPFTKPSVIPESDEEQMAFDELDDIIGDHEPSTAIGWAINLRALLKCKDEIRDMKTKLRGPFQGRSTQNWALLLICAKQV